MSPRTRVRPRRSNWRSPLARSIKVKNGPKLEKLADVRAYILAEPANVQERPAWQLAAAALLAAAEDGGQVGLATDRTENALFLQARWLPPK